MGYTAIVDYGVGNLASLRHAMEYIGRETVVTADAEKLEKADSILLPGVGAFPDAYQALEERGFPKLLREQAEKKPILGSCLGMQLLFDSSDEVRLSPGLGLIPGKVERIQTELKLPHIGWNALRFQTPCPLFAGLDEGCYVYFVHSYCAVAEKEENVTAVTDHGTEVVAAVQKGNVFGSQFHPEKSGDVGLEILKNFVGLQK
jgi:glutamine amidotransferase